ncbi:glycoside hydrolase family 3 protein [Allonocardiopsis opalescens]|uniref:beta-N-acetylhexosaminidase n=1 Tax=Allonocardiopsis opalescens TaxID=1144618 RepID=A0A2T0QCF3_9ACTN|nr:glycoside hydrolase family 3 protein [Allonocardiopsis opalescens]PRY01533.1 beta-N-acetylhexosaminidase [Allonocardiopsis opalescens]
MSRRRQTGLIAIAAALVLGACSTGGEGVPGASADATGGGAEQEAHQVDIEAVLDGMSTEQRVGQLLMPTVPGTTAEEAAPLVEQYHLGGVIYFPENLADAEQIAEMSSGLQEAGRAASAGAPLLLGVDQEQGLVARLGSIVTEFPDAMAIGATGSTDDAATLGRITGTELRALGINTDFVPVGDVNVNPDNPVIGIRSFGADPEAVSAMVAAEVGAFRQAGVATSVKHFPGHGDTATDSHTGLPVIETGRADWEATDLPPFRAAIEAGTDMVMVGHLSMPALDDSGDPATLSEPIVTGVLREELGFEGVVVTDALNMEAVRESHGDGEVAVRALEAGVDLLLMPPDLDLAYNALLTAVEEERISSERLEESVRRVLELKARLGLFPEQAAESGADAPAEIRSQESLAAAQGVADRSVTLLRNDEVDGAPVLPAAEGATVHVSGSGAETLAAALGESGVEVVTEGPAGADLAVVGTNGARGDAEQRAAVAALVDTGTPVVAVAVGTPYDVAALPGIAGYLATYSGQEVSLRAAARVITGEVAPSGRLPVAVPAGDGPEFAIGDGLGY